MKQFREQGLNFTANDASIDTLSELYQKFIQECETTMKMIETIVYPEDADGDSSSSSSSTSSKGDQSYTERFSNIEVFQECTGLLDRLDTLLDEDFTSAESRECFLTQSTSTSGEDDGSSRKRLSVFKEWCTRWIQTIQPYGGYLKAHYVANRAQIVFTTLITSGRRWLQKYCPTFDIVLMDEASQSLAIETLLPLQYSPQIMICIGDHQQLPPVIKSPRCRVFGYGESLMSILLHRHGFPFARLTNQFRMHPSICAYPSQCYYQGELVTDPSILLDRETVFTGWKDRLLQSIVPTTSNQQAAVSLQPSMFFHVPDSKEGKRVDGMTSIGNLKEAEKVLDVVIVLLQMNISPERIGIITFYHQQVELFHTLCHNYAAKEKQLWSAWNAQTEKIQRQQRTTKQQVSTKYGPPALPRIPVHKLLPKPARKVSTQLHKVEISTVDSFQGAEKDIILISMVRTHRSIGFLNDYRRLNVALTRAKYIRWIFGNKEKLLQSIVEHTPHDDRDEEVKNGIVQLIEEHERMNQVMRLPR